MRYVRGLTGVFVIFALLCTAGKAGEVAFLLTTKHFYSELFVLK